MANNPITVPLPQDLPETWATNQIVSPDGVSAGLTPQHGYNYLMQQVNNAQQAAQELGEGIAGLSGDNLPASSDGGETISAALSNKVSHTAKYVPEMQDLHGDARGLICTVPAAAGPEIASINAPPGVEWGTCMSLQVGDIRTLMLIDTSGLWIQYGRTSDWTDWTPIAKAIPPQEYALPLAEGVSGTIKYSKDQMGVVRLLGQVELASAQSGIIGIGVLPEGFHLEYAVTTVCCGWPDGGATVAPCTVVVNADGAVAINAFDVSLKVFAVNVSFGG